MIRFSYTKASGEVSQRVGIVVAEPQKNYGILDLSDLTSEEQKAANEAYCAYLCARKQHDQALAEQYGVTHILAMYKAFKPEGIKDLELCK